MEHLWTFVEYCFTGRTTEVILSLLLSNSKADSNNTFKYVYTPTSQKNMMTLALAVSQGRPILMEGITGAGKTAQITELAVKTGNADIIKVHLGDQADAKVLLGSYICTDVPGEKLQSWLFTH